MNKEIYLKEIKFSRIHDNIGAVTANIIFKDDMNFEEYQKMLKDKYFVLWDKDYITNLQEELQQRIDKAIEYIEQWCVDDEFYVNLTKKEKNIINALNILKGEDK